MLFFVFVPGPLRPGDGARHRQRRAAAARQLHELQRRRCSSSAPGGASFAAGLIIGRDADGALTRLRLGGLAARSAARCAAVALALAHPRRARRQLRAAESPGRHARNMRYRLRARRLDARLRHDHPVAARHRPLQVHDDAGRAASFRRGAGRVPLQVPQPGRRPDAVRRARSATRSARCATCASRRRSSTTCAAGASSRATSSTCSGLFQLDERFIRVDAQRRTRRARSTSRSRGRGCTRSCSRCRCSRSCPRSTTATRVPAPDFAEGRRRLAAKIAQVNAVDRPRVPHRRLRHAPPLLARLARRGAAHAEARHRPELRRHQQRQASRMEHGPDAARHDGARVPAGVPGGRPAAARLAGVRVQHVGARVPRRPRDRAVRRLRDGRVPARLRPLLLQAVRRRAPRLGRPVRVGREADRALPEDAHRPAQQDDGVLRQPQRAARDRACSSTSGAARRRRSASAPTSPTTSATSRCRS